jgi:hypothetical protein
MMSTSAFPHAECCQPVHVLLTECSFFLSMPSTGQHPSFSSFVRACEL